MYTETPSGIHRVITMSYRQRDTPVMAETQSFTQLVVVGSSAGGIEALSTLVGTLPTDFAAPVVIAQHIDPARTSHLGEILGRRGALPVRTVEDAMPLAPGVISSSPRTGMWRSRTAMCACTRRTGAARSRRWTCC